jgi:hypothetical protein
MGHAEAKGGASIRLATGFYTRSNPRSDEDAGSPWPLVLGRSYRLPEALVLEAPVTASVPLDPMLKLGTVDRGRTKIHASLHSALL